MALKKSCEKKIPFEMKSLRLYFLGLFSGFSMISYKNIPGKSTIIAEYAWEQHPKRGAVDIEKRPLLYSKYRCMEKSLFTKTS